MKAFQKCMMLLLSALLLAGPVQAAETVPGDAAETVPSDGVTAETVPGGAATFPMDPSGMKPWINSEVIGMVTEDVTADCKDDYYLAVNHDWIVNTKLRPGYTSETGMIHGTMAMVQERCLELVQDRTLTGEDAARIQTYYDLWLDWDARNEAGLTPFLPAIEQLDAVDTIEEMSDYLLSPEYLHWGTFPAYFSIEEAFADSSVYEVKIDPEDLTLGDTEPYDYLDEFLADGSALKDTALYMLGRIGQEEDAEAILRGALDFEARLAEYELSYDEKNDTDTFLSRINPVTMEDLSRLSPDFPLCEYMEQCGWAESRRINLSEPAWLSGLNAVYTEENLEEIKDWALIKILLTAAEKSDEEAFRTYQAIQNQYNGIDESEPDEALAYNECMDHFPDEFAKLYIEKYITPKDRSEIEEICRDVIATYREMLAETEWLSAEMREMAIRKLDNMKIWALYPDEWEDDSMFYITPKEEGGSYAQACAEYKDGLLKYYLEDVNQSVNPEFWPVDVMQTNAQYNDSSNAICIMAGFLGDSVWRSDMTIEEKYGTLGCVIGHEISHAYDPLGAQFDENGNVADWWTPEDYEEFDRRARKVIDWFDQVVAFDDGTPYTGVNVYREAIADMAGMKCILKMAEEIEGFDYDAFFRANASMWARIDTLPKAKQMLTSDIHPYNYLRVNATLQQFDEFLETYDIREGDGMYLAEEDRILVW